MGTISYAIPQDGQPFATEGPKVDTALSALLTLVNGNIDRTNITPGAGIATATSGLASAIPAAGNFGAEYYATDTGGWSIDNGTNWLPLGLTPGISAVDATVKPGQMLTMTGASTTATLPATASLVSGTLCGVRAGTGITGATLVTIVANGLATNMVVPGNTSARAQLAMGFPASFIVFQWDGVNSLWRVVGGAEDTGWLAITRGTNVNSLDSYTPSCRRVNGCVTLSGSLVTAGTITAGSAIATAGTSFRPSATINLPLVAAGSAAPSPPAAFAMSAGGVITAGVNVGAPVSIALNGINYWLNL